MTDDDDLFALDNAEPMSKIATKRRKRRRAKLRLTHGPEAVRAHRRKTGRTGSIKEKRTYAKGGKSSARKHPNTPFSGWGTR